MPPLDIDRHFPTEFANTIARLESYNKHHYRPNNYLHKWWARRCGSTFRLILKGLVPDPKLRDYYQAGGLEGLIILDPMMGGGTTLHEAIRLGANVIGADLDPIPVLQARASLSEYPLEQLEEAFEAFWSSLHQELSQYFKAKCPICNIDNVLWFTLYGAQRFCSCGSSIIVDSFILRQGRNRPDVRICPQCQNILSGDQACIHSSSVSGISLVEKHQRICLDCHEQYQETTDVPYFARYVPLADASNCPEHGMVFSQPQVLNPDCLAELKEARNSLAPCDFEIEPGPKSDDLLHRGISSYLDLFSDRQLTYIQAATKGLESLEPLPKLNLALLISTSLEFNSLLCGYKGGASSRPGAVRHTFSHHAYSIPYTSLENNPLNPDKASGTLQRLFHDRIRRARQWALVPRERRVKDGIIHQVSITGELDVGTEVEHTEQLMQGIRRFLLLSGSSSSLDVESGSVDAVVTAS